MIGENCQNVSIWDSPAPNPIFEGTNWVRGDQLIGLRKGNREAVKTLSPINSAIGMPVRDSHTEKTNPADSAVVGHCTRPETTKTLHWIKAYGPAACPLDAHHTSVISAFGYGPELDHV